MLRIKELELKPDVTSLFQASQDFYEQQTKAQTAMTQTQTAMAQMMKELIEAVHKHDADVSVRMGPVYDSLKSMGDGIKELLKRSDPKKA
jgi:hypothetical protein